jgi:hypothetical protein
MLHSFLLFDRQVAKNAKKREKGTRKLGDMASWRFARNIIY